MIQKDILRTCGKRFARIIADAQPGDTITASIAFCHATQDEIRQWASRGWIGIGERDITFNGVKTEGTVQ